MKIAIISDIHEDFLSLQNAARLIEKERCDEIICLGDIVGFSVPYYTYFDTRDASACVAWVKANCKHVVAGNHDLYAVRKMPKSDVRGFTFPHNWYEMPFKTRQEIALNKVWLFEDNELSALLDDDAFEYLQGLPESIVAEEDGLKCLITHFIHPDITGSSREFLYSYEDLIEHLILMKNSDCVLGFSGHLHANGLVKLSGEYIDKPGFGRTIPLLPFDWIGAPSISNSNYSAGFLIWDTVNHIIEAVSIKQKFKMRLTR